MEIENKNMKTKKIIIKQTETKEGFETNFDVVGFTNWEVLGLLSYYIDAYKIVQLKKYNNKP